MKRMEGAKGPKFYGNGKAPKCGLCDMPATHTAVVPVSWFRGEDERIFRCEEHAKEATR